jgi:hypothetical protein
VPSLVFSLVVDLGGHNKNRFPTIAGPPIGLRESLRASAGPLDWAAMD